MKLLIGYPTSGWFRLEAKALGIYPLSESPIAFVGDGTAFVLDPRAIVLDGLSVIIDPRDWPPGAPSPPAWALTWLDEHPEWPPAEAWSDPASIPARDGPPTGLARELGA